MATIHLVPHTHWDREWYQTYQVFRMRLVHLVDLLLEILEQDAQFRCFSLDGQTILLEDYLEVRPEELARLTSLIEKGRILIGPWYVLPDEFLVSPESLVRNLLLGSQLSAGFGARMDVGYLPDPFGHLSQMPQILAGFGIATAALRRGLASEPCELWWQSPDGSRVLLSYLRDGYDNAARLPGDPGAFAQTIRERIDSLRPHCLSSQFLLMNGSDHHEPQAHLPSLLGTLEGPQDQVLISNLPDYFAALREEIEREKLDLPTVQGELRSPRRHHLLPGVLSGRAWIKLRNHACESLLERYAEPLLAWAGLVSSDPPDQTVWTGHLRSPRLQRPEKLLELAWRLLLHCHPHDSICGCSIDQVHEEMRNRFDQAEQIGKELAEQSLTAIAAQIDSSGMRRHGALGAFVVYNPTASPRSDMVRVRLELPAGADPFEIVDEQGDPVLYRLIQRKARSLADMEVDSEGLRGMLALVQNGRALGLAVQSVAVVAQSDSALIDIILAEEAEPNQLAVEAGMRQAMEQLDEGAVQRFRLRAQFATQAEIELLVPSVPALGYRTFGLRPGAALTEPTPASPGTSIENRFLHVQAEPDGSLSLHDKARSRTYRGLLRLVDRGDRGDSYTFCPVDDGQSRLSPLQAAHVLVRHFPGGQELKMQLLFRIPAALEPDRLRRGADLVELPVVISATLLDSANRLDLQIELENRASDHRLQVAFPFGEIVEEAHYGGHFDLVTRSTELQQGGADWAEQPVPEVPMVSYVAVCKDRYGLLVAADGLREASVDRQGDILITLLRCYGWLSRNDLDCRQGGAGPQLEVPGGQSVGRHSFRLSLIPFGQDLMAARLQAEAFLHALQATGTGLHDGVLPSSGSFLTLEPTSFALTAIKAAQDGEGLIVRGVNLSHEPLEVRLHSLLAIEKAGRVRLDESAIQPLEPSGRNSLHFGARPREIVSLKLILQRAVSP